jgi:hypothetical protein
MGRCRQRLWVCCRLIAQALLEPIDVRGFHARAAALLSCDGNAQDPEITLVGEVVDRLEALEPQIDAHLFEGEQRHFLNLPFLAGARPAGDDPTIDTDQALKVLDRIGEMR